MPAEHPNPLVPAKDQEVGPTPRLPCRRPWAEQAGSLGWCQLNRKEEALTVPLGRWDQAPFRMSSERPPLAAVILQEAFPPCC